MTERMNSSGTFLLTGSMPKQLRKIEYENPMYAAGWISAARDMISRRTGVLL
ncbi:hypothetical protein L2D14_13630 [Thalassospiraceae bacterium LMO-JJ14]|nr:hypothetical protein L2D14_13630 [Thalassospiraceae bacterium LMO-JJ14]